MKTKELLQTHPKSPTIREDLLTTCINACFECVQTCTTCADACLGEDSDTHFTNCIRTCLDCADTCDATGRILSRLGRPAPARIRPQVQACALACQTCEDLCQKHADGHKHCQVCAEACRQCREVCETVVKALDDIPT